MIRRRQKIDDGLGDAFRQHLPQVHWQRIESPLTGRGIPDANGCHAGQEFWLETKATRTTFVNLEPEQVGWHLRRAAAGGVTWIAVRRRHAGGPRKGPAVDQLWLCPGAQVRALRETGLVFLELMWEGGPSAWPWVSILQCIKERASPLLGRGQKIREETKKPGADPVEKKLA